VEKLAVKELHKDNQALFKVVRWRERKSEAGISDKDVEEKNRVDISSVCPKVRYVKFVRFR